MNEKKQILMVCTGNTCRSPMAEVIGRRLLAERGYSDRYEIRSAGLSAFPNDPAAENARITVREHGLSLENHAASQLTVDDIRKVQIICVMSTSHKNMILSILPEVEEKIHVLNIPDPYGGTLDVYRQCYERIEQALRSFIEELK